MVYFIWHPGQNILATVFNVDIDLKNRLKYFLCFLLYTAAAFYLESVDKGLHVWDARGCLFTFLSEITQSFIKIKDSLEHITTCENRYTGNHYIYSSFPYFTLILLSMDYTFYKAGNYFLMNPILFLELEFKMDCQSVVEFLIC